MNLGSDHHWFLTSQKDNQVLGTSWEVSAKQSYQSNNMNLIKL